MEDIAIQPRSFESLITKVDELTAKLDLLLSNKPPKEILSGKDVCILLNVSPRTLQRYRERKLIGFSQVGPKIIYTWASVDKFMSDHHIKATCL